MFSVTATFTLSSLALALITRLCMAIAANLLPPLSLTLRHISTLATKLKWACNYLLNLSVLGQDHNLGLTLDEPTKEEEHGLGVTQYDGEQPAECAVCLCEVQVGDEIRELQCDHVFHKACLDKWLNQCCQWTCPLCRDFVARRRFDLWEAVGVQVIRLRFRDLSSGDREAWWLR